jgi:phage terminase large subunit-like protein
MGGAYEDYRQNGGAQMNRSELDRPLLGAEEAWNPVLWQVLGVTEHPVAPLPSEAWMRSHSLGELLEFINEREQTIHAMIEDPFRNGFEPRQWWILDAICGFPWVDPKEAEVRRERDPVRRAAMQKMRDDCLAVRRALLKQDEPVHVLLLNGGNRGGKSEWAGSRVVKILMWKDGRRAWAFHQDESMSVEYQQALTYKYLPAELRTEKGIKCNPTYVSFKQQTGFSDMRFVLPNRSDCSFRNYSQKFEKIQGGELDVAWCDELVPASWIKELKARVATRGGWLLITFTPVQGYSPTVKMFDDKAVTTREAVAFVLPADGGEPLLDLAMAGDDADVWMHPNQSGQPAVPAGRRFERVPRCKRVPGDKLSAIFFIHCWDNAFGNPRELYELHKGDMSDYRRMKFYGVAVKAMRVQFPAFSMHHIVEPSQVPAVGTRFHVVDPCSGRNWAMLWALVDRGPVGLRVWIYREWPCPGVYVPGVGDMGEWAEPGEKLDGEKGPAQNPLGWGHSRYREEVFRLEGKRYTEPLAATDAEDDFVFDEWDRPAPRRVVKSHRRRVAEGGEDVYDRVMDSRYGATPTQTREGQTTLLEECAKLGFEPDFVPASGRDIDDGTYLINDFLKYDVEQPISSLNSPRLFVSSDCKNTIFALQNWTGADGQHGACKDFVDLLRYLLLHEIEDWTERDRMRKAG